MAGPRKEVTMASISPINLTSNLNLYNFIQPGAANSAQASKTTALAASPETDATDQVDTVQLSAAAQAKLLHKDVKGLSTIAASSETTAKTATTVQEDPVKLSASAQAKLLHKEGQSVANIAASFGATTATVDSYLGITVTSAINQALQAAEAVATVKA
jgi:hypothetical protein